MLPHYTGWFSATFLHFTFWPTGHRPGQPKHTPFSSVLIRSLDQGGPCVAQSLPQIPLSYRRPSPSVGLGVRVVLRHIISDIHGVSPALVLEPFSPLPWGRKHRPRIGTGGTGGTGGAGCAVCQLRACVAAIACSLTLSMDSGGYTPSHRTGCSDKVSSKSERGWVCVVWLPATK